MRFLFFILLFPVTLFGQVYEVPVGGGDVDSIVSFSAINDSTLIIVNASGDSLQATIGYPSSTGGGGNGDTLLFQDTTISAGNTNPVDVRRFGYSVTAVNMADTLTVDLQSFRGGIFRFDMTGNNNIVLNEPTNPVDGAVYNFHFVSASNGTVTFPASFVKEDGATQLNSIGVPVGEMVTFYYFSGTYYTMEN